MIVQNNMDLMEKLTILSDAAKYDAACTSSGVNKNNNGSGNGNSIACGICHSFAADGRCISLLKILFTNECIFNCQYCLNRSSNDVVRTTFTPEEVCTLTMQFYRRNYIEGLFLSSGIIKSPDYTMTKLIETVILLREKYHFGGYIHLKGIPGASADLIETAGWFVDRMSVNLELPTAEGLRTLAPHKSRKTILTPMKQIQNGITDNRNRFMIDDSKKKQAISHFLNKSSFFAPASTDYSFMAPATTRNKDRYVPAGQSTQMIIGATPESDYQIVTVAESLYKQFDLKRVFYSAFINVNKDSSLPIQNSSDDVPLLREHRLYQADWLMRFYGFKSDELLSENKPNFNVFLDPKCDWAIAHLENFPVEINKADYYTLLRVPGIGVNSAKRIVKARRSTILNFDDLKKIGVVLKRAIYFITCNGRMMYTMNVNEDFITNSLISADYRKTYEIGHQNSYKQLSLFDDYNLTTGGESYVKPTQNYISMS